MWELPSEQLLFEAWQILHASEEAGEHSSEGNMEVERVQLPAVRKQGFSAAALRLNLSNLVVHHYRVADFMLLAESSLSFLS